MGEQTFVRMGSERRFELAIRFLKASRLAEGYKMGPHPSSPSFRGCATAVLLADLLGNPHRGAGVVARRLGEQFGSARRPVRDDPVGTSR
jgi:hypothetical protein